MSEARSASQGPEGENLGKPDDVSWFYVAAAAVPSLLDAGALTLGDYLMKNGMVLDGFLIQLTALVSWYGLFRVVSSFLQSHSQAEK